ncbi:MAG: hypothetical protein IBX68_12310 [Dehalococcoidia bacterium]|nr:hypothetical protein [Dehalococcoidia bacterium]
MNPFTEKGIPIEKQFQPWSELNQVPYDKGFIHPYTRTRIILMNGIEVEGIYFSHNFARSVADIDLKRQLAATRRIEQQQQKLVNWFPPGNESTLEVTIGYEQVAVDLTAYMARTEPDPKVKAALDFALLEDFDHLYRYSNLMELTEGKTADRTVKELTEIMPGRPTIAEHRHPMDSIRTPVDRASADPLTLVHILTIVAGEQQTMNFYMNVGNRPESMLGRGLYLEIAQIEEQHVSHYESLLDPNMSWFEKLVLHEYNECYMYWSCLNSEIDDRVKQVWQHNLEQEIEHLRISAELMKKFERRDPAELYPASFPQPTIFESSKDYIREILRSQIDLTEKETEYAPTSRLPENYRYFQFQKMANNGGNIAPSQQVIEDTIKHFGRDYRLETEGPHPVQRLRARETAAV